jgi:hypothetical protein
VTTTTGEPAGRSRFRGRAVIAGAFALAVFAFPQAAQAHGRSAVIALDYEARPAQSGQIAPGVEAKVVDGDRSLELRVAPGRTVVVRGYGGEPFLRFSSRGVEANLGSPTAVADRLVPEQAVTTVAGAPRWQLVTGRHRLTWHDHRLGPRAGVGAGTGVVGKWAIPLVVDGRPVAVRGALLRSARPALWFWLAILSVALAAAAAVAWRGGLRARHASVYLATAISSVLLLAVSAGFAAGSARSGFTRWADLALPAGIALAAAAVFVLRPRQRYVACGLVAGFALAAALEDVGVFWHGFVVSTQPAPMVRAGVSIALGASAFAIVVVLADLVRADPGARRRRAPGGQPRLAVPKGKPR